MINKCWDGPGEILQPSAIVEDPLGALVVVQRGSPRVTVYTPDGEPTSWQLPGNYGFWASALSSRLALGSATRTTRLALLEFDGTPVRSFGSRSPAISETPFWIFFAQEHITAYRDEIYLNTSFEPRIRVFDPEGDSVRSLDVTPTAWEPPSHPGIERLQSDADRARIGEWSRSFSIVTAIEAVDPGVVLVQYGRHDPTERDPTRATADRTNLYTTEGRWLARDLGMDRPILAGGVRLYLLASSPPGEWIITVHEASDLLRQVSSPPG